MRNRAMEQTKVAVVAVGGNSLIKDKQHQDVASQRMAVEETCRHIADMIDRANHESVSRAGAFQAQPPHEGRRPHS